MSKVLLIGWDAADWKVINPLMDAGLMPSLQGFIEQGVMGKLATLDPVLSPMLWTSIATGKRPYKHGIHGFTEPDPSRKSVRPIFNTNRTCKAVWNILNQENKKCHVVGWWPSHPAEPINGTMVSNFFQRPEMRSDKPWTLPKGTVHPEEKTDLFAKMRVHPNELTAAHIFPFVANLEKVDQINDPRLSIVTSNLAATATLHCAATYILEHEDWDFTAVYFDAIDHLCHGFMKFYPPRRPHIPIQDFELYSEVVNAVYRFHDMMLGRYLELIDDDTTVIIVSDHGFHPGDNRPEHLPKEPTAPAIEHSPYGMIAMKGPGIKKDELIFGASLLDVTPTLLHIFDLPSANDMDGKVLINAFEDARTKQPIDSWELVEGNDGRHKSDAAISAEDMDAELRQLIELGYVDDPGDDVDAAIKLTLDENNYHLARAYINGQKWDEGIKLLEALHAENPDVLRFASHLANAYQFVGKFKQARKVVNHIREILDRESPQVDLLEGTLLLSEQRPLKALELFKKVEAEAGDQPQLRLKLANAYFQLNKFEDAEKLLLSVIDADEEEVGAWYLIGLCYFNLGNYELAIEHLLQAIGLQYFQPVAHYYLAESLLLLEKYEESATAYEVCLRLAPKMNYARKRLITIYEQYLNQPEKADQFREDFDRAYKGKLVIVSGLPRSGTSMMMQMLTSGGIEAFTDDERKPDENNQKGYFEHEAVKNLAKNKDWLPEANGKAVKVIAQLIPHLPLNYRYKVIFMERDISEVLSSQHKMLGRMGKESESNSSLKDSYETSVQDVKDWIADQRNFDVIYVDYASVIEDPLRQSERINEFIGGNLDVTRMKDAVDAGMRRERSTVV
ncbi:MAG TPA: alkaline phosphatase family protein [Pyrinomonadaceae bacterium]|nr:alkaline phosphatase family protein [Pyrinomonadaceae bacterium]